MNNKWYESAVFYHIFVLSLANAEPENDYLTQHHRLDLIAAWIPYIKSLGCNAVLFSPVLKSKTHGYDVSDYFQIDNRLGTNEEFKALVDEFHRNDIKVVLDSVYNHSGRDFFAFQELKNGKREFADWFLGVNFNEKSPLGDDFTYDTWSGYFELVKFNLKNDKIIDYLMKATQFWMNEFGIDGLRLDSANVMDFDFMRRLRCATHEKHSDFWLMGEVVGGDYSKWVNSEMLDSVTNYILFKSLHSGHNDNNLFELEYALRKAVPNQGIPNYTFLDNHDQPRIASNVDKHAFLYTLYALLFTLPGVPSIYYGSEFGIEGQKVEHGPDDAIRPYIDSGAIKDLSVLLEGKCEEDLKTYFGENAKSENAKSGNSKLTLKSTGWELGLEVAKEEVSLPVDINLPHYIQSLIKMRENSAALKYGIYNTLYIEYHKPFIFERVFDCFGSEKPHNEQHYMSGESEATSESETGENKVGESVVECGASCPKHERIIVAINISDEVEYISLTEYCGKNIGDLFSHEVLPASALQSIPVCANSARIFKELK
jgi:glycosidase